MNNDMKKAFLYLFLTVTWVMTTRSQTVPLSGPCGKSGSTVKWEFDPSGKILLIGGEGEMADFACGEAPWHHLTEHIYAVAVGNKVKSIGKCAFAGCKNLQKALISASVESIGDSAFMQCKELREYKITPAVREIAPTAFQECTRLQFVIEEGNTHFSLYNNALIDNGHRRLLCLSPAYRLTAFEVPPSVREIGCAAFFACTVLESVRIPAQTTALQPGAFTLCHGLKEIDIENGHPTLAEEDGIIYDKDKTKVIVCPAGREKKSVKIPSTVTEICPLAFSDCRLVKSIRIPPTVTRIGRNAFAVCVNLKSINLSEGITEIPPFAFRGCIWLKSLELPQGVTRIGDSAFEQCESITTMHIPDGVTELPDNVFKHCVHLEEITLPDKLTSIGEKAFVGCNNLKRLHIPADIPPGIEEKLHPTTLPTAYERIESRSHTKSGRTHTISYSRLQKVPHAEIKTKKAIGKYLYYTASSKMQLREITVNDDNLFYSAQDGILYNKDRTVLLFAAGRRDNVQIPETVREIAPFAFSGADVFKVHIPESVERIGECALPYRMNNDVPQRMHFYVHSTVPPELAVEQYLHLAAFYQRRGNYLADGETRLLALHVPAGCRERYEQAPVWGEIFKGCIEDDIRQEADTAADNAKAWRTAVRQFIRFTPGYEGTDDYTKKDSAIARAILQKEGKGRWQGLTEAELEQKSVQLAQEYSRSQKTYDAIEIMLPYYKKAMTLGQLQGLVDELNTEGARRAWELSQTDIETTPEAVAAMVLLAAGVTPPPLEAKECTPEYKALVHDFLELNGTKDGIHAIFQSALPETETEDSVSTYLENSIKYLVDNMETIMLNHYIDVLSEEDLRLLCDIFRKPSGQAARKAILYMAENGDAISTDKALRFKTWVEQTLQ